MRWLLSILPLLALFYVMSACVSADQAITSSSEHIEPGTQVLASGSTVALYPGSLRIGESFGEKAQSLSFEPLGAPAIVNIIPSLDSTVCEAQTFLLGEASDLHPSIKRVVISRDLPQAQNRFAKYSGLEHILYYSDYKEGAFGKSTGLLMKGTELLTRGVVVLDREGRVRYQQFVPKIDQLPDMQKAISFANSLVE